MNAGTQISWTDETWNPTVGCTRVSAGCRHCYAFDLHDLRHQAFLAGKLQGVAQYARPFREVQLKPERLSLPLGWRRPRRIFVDSVSDLLHPDVPDTFVDQVFAVMFVAAERGHTFQLLTKRVERLRTYLLDDRRRRRVADALTGPLRGRVKDEDGWWDRIASGPGPLSSPRIWLGTSVEDQRAAATRVPALLHLPAGLRFLSLEPLLGPVNLQPWLHYDHGPEEADLAASGMPGGEELCQGRAGLGKRPDSECHAVRRSGIGWMIVGGESGPHARPMHPEWARDLRDQAATAHIPFHFKQWGLYAPRAELEAAQGRGELRLPRRRLQTLFQHVSGVASLPPVQHDSLTELLRQPRGRAWPLRTLDGRVHDAFPD